MDEERVVVCSRCGGLAYRDDDGRQAPYTPAPDPCRCPEIERPPHWRS
ncbi:MAG: hypothetical protein ACRDY1_14385 [Acidimicrobiales bacterium]